MPASAAVATRVVTPREKKILATVSTVSLVLFVGLGLITSTRTAESFDRTIRNGLHARSSPLLNRVMLAATDLGSTQIVTSISFGALFCFLLLRKNRTALLLALDMAVAVFVDTALKDAFHRARPQPFFDLAVPPSFSYPSGHAFFSMCCYGMLAILLAVHVKNLAARVAILIGGASLVLGIGISRIYLGVHYPSDVLGGWLLGLAWVCALLTSEGRFRKRVPESA